jgi:zinc protease
MQRGGAPVLAVRAFVDAGMLREARPGVAAFAGVCLDEGAAGRSGREIASFVESRGAALSTGALGASLRCLARDAGECLDAVRDVLLRPDFDAAVVERKRGELVSEFLAENDDPSLVGRERLRAEIYGVHPYARRDKGSVEALRAIAGDDLRAHHAAQFVPRNAIVAAVGDLPVEELERLVADRFGGWADVPPRVAVPPSIPFPERGGEVRVEEDREQLHVYLGHLGIRRSDPDYHALLVADVALGSGPGFTDRLSKRLRDEMGLAYTVFARIARGSDLEPGTFTAYIGTAPKLRDAALAGMREEIARFVAEGPTEREVEDARSYLLGSYVFGFETVDVSAEHLVQLERFGLGFDYPDRFARAVEALTPTAVLEAVRRHVFPERLVAVLVGRTRE